MPASRTDPNEHALDRLLQALPGPVRRGHGWIMQPGRAWLRIPVAILLIVSGFLGFLPLLGFWMLPIGALLLAEDVPVLRRPTLAALAAVQGWWDRMRAQWARRRDG